MLKIDIKGSGNKEELIDNLLLIIERLQETSIDDLVENSTVWEDPTLLTQIAPVFVNPFSDEEIAVLKAWSLNDFPFPAPEDVSDIKRKSFDGSWAEFKRTILKVENGIDV